jgi:hypothetical protein
MRITGQEMTFCKTCGKPTLQIYNEDRCSHILHLLLSVFTVGLWIPVWLCCAFSAGRGEPTCTVCGTKRGESLGTEARGPMKTVAQVIALLIVLVVIIAALHQKPATSVPSSNTPTADAKAVEASSTPDKAANWKVIEDMRNGVVQSTPTPTPTVVPHLIMGDNKANYKPSAQALAQEKEDRTRKPSYPSGTAKRLLQEAHEQGLDRMRYKSYSELTPEEREQKDAIDKAAERAKQQADEMDKYYDKMGWKD